MGSDKICDGGSGVFLPMGYENSWPMGLRTPLYFFFLLWCFAGVSIVADIFMAAIEAITSQKKTIVHNDHEVGGSRVADPCKDRGWMEAKPPS